jgi:hypothetical protein
MSGATGHEARPPRHFTAAQPLTIRDLVEFLTTYGDWGNRCMTAYSAGEVWWRRHLEWCESCAAVQAEWDRQAAKAGAA